MVIAYRVYTETNYRDTCRDPDDIRIVEVGTFMDRQLAIDEANKFIKNHFLHKNTMLYENDKGILSACDCCSYGSIIYVEPVVLIHNNI